MLFATDAANRKLPTKQSFGLLFSLLVFLCLDVNVRAENYRTLLNKLDSYCIDDLKAYPQLSYVEFKKDSGYGNFHFSGWLETQTAEYFQFLEVTGQRVRLRKAIVSNIVGCSANDEILEQVQEYQGRLTGGFVHGKNFLGWAVTPYYVVALWAYKKGNEQLYNSLLSRVRERDSSDEYVMRFFGNLYFNEMLYAYSHERDYVKAASLGEHLASRAFTGFEYQVTAVELARQLKERQDDFSKLALPDSIHWLQIKTGMSRKEQLVYLLDRIHILNCVQYAQPGDISYADEQHTISDDSVSRCPGFFWNNLQKYPVINPYSEILSMKPLVSEIEVIAPRILEDEYIPSYSFFRNFSAGRKVHKYNWVIEDLLFHISNKHFVDMSAFEKQDSAKRNQEVDGILAWCRANANISEQERRHQMLIETSGWEEFKRALQISVDSKDCSITEILPKKFSSFDQVRFAWPTPKSVIAQAMFNLSSGSEPDRLAVMDWEKNVDDESVKLWTSMFLLKFDTVRYYTHLETLRQLLKQGEGTTFYWDAMKLLLQQKDPKAREVAEGILRKSGFLDNLEWRRNQECLKLLLLYKSKATLTFLTDGLNNFTIKERSGHDPGTKLVVLKCDRFVSAIAHWRDDRGDYSVKWPIKERQEYCRTLSQWLVEQYALIEAGKESAIKSEL